MKKIKKLSTSYIDKNPVLQQFSLDNKVFEKEIKSSRLTIDLNHCNLLKFNELYSLIDNVKTFKNSISTYCYNHILDIINDYQLFVSDCKLFVNKHLNSWEIQNIFQEISGHYHDTITKYLSKAKFISTNIEKPFSFIRYKRSVNSHIIIKSINNYNNLTINKEDFEIITQLLYLKDSPKPDSFKHNINKESKIVPLLEFIFKNSTIHNTNQLNFDIDIKQQEINSYYYKYINELKLLKLNNNLIDNDKLILKLENKIKAYVKLKNIVNNIIIIQINKSNLYSRLISLVLNKQLRLLSKVKCSIYKTGTHTRSFNFSHIELIYDKDNILNKHFLQIKRYGTLQNIHSKSYLEVKYNDQKDLIKEILNVNKLKSDEEKAKEFNEHNYLYLPLIFNKKKLKEINKYFNKEGNDLLSAQNPQVLIKAEQLQKNPKSRKIHVIFKYEELNPLTRILNNTKDNKLGEYESPNEKNTLGLDVNIKNNLLADSEGIEYKEILSNVKFINSVNEILRIYAKAEIKRSEKDNIAKKISIIAGNEDYDLLTINESFIVHLAKEMNFLTLGNKLLGKKLTEKLLESIIDNQYHV